LADAKWWFHQGHSDRVPRAGSVTAVTHIVLLSVDPVVERL
jgi:hypothetical protein